MAAIHFGGDTSGPAARIQRSRIARLSAASLALLFLAACGDDKAPEAKKAAPQVAAAAPAASDSGSATLKAGTEGHNEKSQDVLKWLEMTPDKAVKTEPPKPADPPKPGAPAAPPAAAAPTAPAPSPIVIRTETPPAPAAVAAAAPARVVPATPAPAPAPVAVAAVAPPPAAPVAAQTTLKLINREQPAFPRDAVREGVTNGHVKVRLTVNPDGSVGKVDIIESQPRKVFDRVVTAAASRWKYAPIPEAQTTTAEFDFKLDE